MGEALDHTQRGVDFPQFKAIFKSDEYQAVVNQVLTELFNLPGDLEFICVRSEAEAQSYLARVPALWQVCDSGELTYSDETTLFICSQFLQRSLDPGNPRPDACPFVNNNKFYSWPGRKRLFQNRASRITGFVLHVYNELEFFNPDISDYNVVINLPFGWRGVEAIEKDLSYLMYIECG